MTVLIPQLCWGEWSKQEHVGQQQKAYYVWIQHRIHHLAPNGKIGLVLTNGALSTQFGGEELKKNKEIKIGGIIYGKSKINANS